eukprot:TRINITY_DN90377_c0_g1_i1.p1 TRINITY_DN90377_c0_g1~~TRINITY_DN90377_c0_g1_i1.p1  ORF type:complete len:130 (-),score=26.62 TRINITY_DN90377_c0_g1_i1:70-459(-)
MVGNRSNRVRGLTFLALAALCGCLLSWSTSAFVSGPASQVPTAKTSAATVRDTRGVAMRLFDNDLFTRKEEELRDPELENNPVFKTIKSVQDYSKSGSKSKFPYITVIFLAANFGLIAYFLSIRDGSIS